MPYTVIKDVVVCREEGTVHYPAGTRIVDDLPETAELLAAGKIVPEGQEPVGAVTPEEPRCPYTVVEEFIVQRGESAVHICDVGSTVELTDGEAAQAGAAVSRESGETVTEPADDTESADGSSQETPEGNGESADGEPGDDAGDTPHSRRSRRP